VDDVMEQLVDFEGGAATTASTTEPKNNGNTENQTDTVKSEEESQQKNVSDASEQPKVKESPTAGEIQENTLEKKEPNGEGIIDEKVEDDDDDESLPPPEGEFEVEAIVDHEKKKGKHSYLIKWKGYGEDEMTWENEDNLNCPELVSEYWGKKEKAVVAATKTKKAEGKQKRFAKDSAKGKSKSATEKTDKRGRPKADDNDRPRKQRKRKGDFEHDDWENQVVSVETVTRDDKTGELMVFLRWTNGETSKHPSKEANIRCPQKMIKFYEQRLTFAPPASNKT